MLINYSHLEEKKLKLHKENSYMDKSKFRSLYQTNKW